MFTNHYSGTNTWYSDGGLYSLSPKKLKGEVGYNLFSISSVDGLVEPVRIRAEYITQCQHVL